MFHLGFIGVNKQGLTYEVIDATRAKQIKIRFEDGVEVITTRSYLLKGLPLHPTKGKMFKGDVHKDKHGLEFELVKKDKGSSWVIRYIEDGVECLRSTETIKLNAGRHPTKSFISVGDVFKVNAGTVKVLEYNSATNVIVEFEDGSVVRTTTISIKLGTVGHPTSGLKIGQKFKTNSGWEGTIIDYKSCYEVGIKWQDGSIEYHPVAHIKSGAIKPACQPSVADVGYFGIGRFTSGLKKEGEKAPDEIYAYWQRMLTRTFNPEEILKNGGRWYLFVSVHKDWFCFQNFAEWALKQPNWNLGYELDKDLIGNGLEYSETKCTFLPADINIFLAENCSKDVHDLPNGVQYIKPATSGSKEGYIARCHTDKGREYLGYFDDPMVAHAAYKVKKEEYAKVLAEKYKSTITKEAYDSLINFKVKMYHHKPHECSSRT